jgi:rhodanese-related sulfurtransferase
MENKFKGRLKGISSVELKKKLDEGAPPFILDVRTPDEFETLRLGIGETLIPIGELRDRLDDLPQNKDREIVCYCKLFLRGYEAAILLEAAGGRNVRVLEGGVMAWPFRREK